MPSSPAAFDAPQAAPTRRITEADRAVWRNWAQARAQDAFRRGRIATDRGQPQEALRWLERARRLAPHAPHVTFPLAVARMNCGDPHGAIRLLQPLVQQFDFREGWVTLAAARRAAGSPDEAAAAIAGALSRHAPDQAVLTLLTDVARAAGWPGWCGLSGDGRLHLDRPAPASARSEAADALTLRLDGVSWPQQTRRRVTTLTGDWRRGHRLEVLRGGRPLLGSPLDIQAILRVEGFVEVRDGKLAGWVWHPGEPERVPLVTVEPVAAPGHGLTLAMPGYADDIQSERPLARPRELLFPSGSLAGEFDGPVRLRGSDGRDLLGSPLDPGLELRAAAAAALLQARHSTSTRRHAAPNAADASAPEAADETPIALPPFLPISAWLVGRWPAVSSAPAPPVDVVVPVYRHLRRTMDCLNSVLASVPAETGLVVVEDASPEPALARALDEMAAAGRIRLIRHVENTGFPASANDGIAACPGRDVVLLNSDTLVAPGWLEALRGAAYHASEIGTATPLSNDASILSYPDHRDRNKAPDLAGTRRMMAQAASANPDAVHDIPTGNGFCLYLRRDCLDQVGLLREDLFAQGYGEENDFCLRARHLGWRHVAALGVYVSHYGNVSFGLARAELMRRNLDVLNRLHPGYNEMILEHIAADPLAPARRRLDLVRWSQARRSRTAPDMAPRAVLLITHDQGGGVDRVVQERARQLRAQGIRPIILRPDRLGTATPEAGTATAPEAGEEGRGVVLSDAASQESYPNLRYALPGEFEELVTMLGAEGVLHAEWHHLLGHHASLRALCDRLGVPYDAYIHDYAWFCQRIALVGPQGRYCGEPDIAGCETCVAIQGSNLDETISMPALLTRSAIELAAARRVVAPSRDAARRITRHFPRVRPDVSAWEDDRPDLSLERLAAASTLAPRPGGERTPRRSPAAGQARPRDQHPARIVVIGGIGREKGYEVLLACIEDARMRALPLEFVVVGHTPDDGALIEAGCVFVTGEYREDEAIGLIGAQEADLALLPSIWPETWCFTLSLAWRAGLAVASFDIGAQAERIRSTGRGVVLPLGLPVAELNTVLMKLCMRTTALMLPPSATMQTIAEPRHPSHHRSPQR